MEEKIGWIDFYNKERNGLPELIYGEKRCADLPMTVHYEIAQGLVAELSRFIEKSNLDAAAFGAPYTAVISKKEDIVVRPDAAFVWNKERIGGIYCDGAPDWIAEVISFKTKSLDCYEKLAIYEKFGVKEYWILDPGAEKVYVFAFEEEEIVKIYTFFEGIPSSSIPGFTVKIADLIHCSQLFTEKKQEL